MKMWIFLLFTPMVSAMAPNETMNHIGNKPLFVIFLREPGEPEQTCSVTCNRLQVTVTVTGYM